MNPSAVADPPCLERASAAPEPAVCFVLMRLAFGEATRAELVRELTPYCAHKLSGAGLRELVEGVCTAARARGLLEERRGRFALTEAGRRRLAASAGDVALPRSWSEARDARLVAVALGHASMSAARLRRLARPDGVRAEILAASYSLPAQALRSPVALRSALAVVALARAFGKDIAEPIGSARDFPAKAARVLAARLLRKPRDPGTDARLISALAAEAVGAVRPGPDQLRLAILRTWIGSSLPSPGADGPARPSAGAPMSTAPEERRPRVPAAASRPDIAGFASAVQRAARPYAEGWPGNRKALLSKVWASISAAYPHWGLSEVEFKAMLSEAHRTGHLALASADLKDKSALKDLQSSAVTYKNTVWHLVRVED